MNLEADLLQIFVILFVGEEGASCEPPLINLTADFPPVTAASVQCCWLAGVKLFALNITLLVRAAGLVTSALDSDESLMRRSS